MESEHYFCLFDLQRQMVNGVLTSFFLIVFLPKPVNGILTSLLLIDLQRQPVNGILTSFFLIWFYQQPDTGILTSFLLIGYPMPTGWCNPNISFANWISNDNRLMGS